MEEPGPITRELPFRTRGVAGISSRMATNTSANYSESPAPCQQPGRIGRVSARPWRPAMIRPRTGNRRPERPRSAMPWTGARPRHPGACVLRPDRRRGPH